MTDAGKMLLTMKEITAYVGRDKRTVKKWVQEENFPAAKVDGRWESNTALIDRFRQRRIENLCGAAGAGG